MWVVWQRLMGYIWTTLINSLHPGASSASAESSRMVIFVATKVQFTEPAKAAEGSGYNYSYTWHGFCPRIIRNFSMITPTLVPKVTWWTIVKIQV
jgi:hypothetical protein